MDTDLNKKTPSKKIAWLVITVIVLLLLAVGAGIYIWKQQQEMSVMVEQFGLEKEELFDEYNDLSLQYEGYKFSVGNDSLVSLLQNEQMKVQRLLEELKTVKATNAKRIGELKKELELLRTIMRGYVRQIDSLNTENTQLKEENVKVNKRYEQATATLSQVSKEKDKLVERVTLASKLETTGISVAALNNRGKSTKKLSNAQQLAISFNIVKNITAPVGEKTIYIRIMKPDGDVLMKSRDNLFTFEGKSINYSSRRVIEYEGEEIPVTIYWDIEEYLSPGEYRVHIFADGNVIGQKTFTLEK